MHPDIQLHEHILLFSMDLTSMNQTLGYDKLQQIHTMCFNWHHANILTQKIYFMELKYIKSALDVKNGWLVERGQSLILFVLIPWGSVVLINQQIYENTHLPNFTQPTKPRYWVIQNFCKIRSHHLQMHFFRYICKEHFCIVHFYLRMFLHSGFQLLVSHCMAFQLAHFNSVK